jgi:hypothetical protein
MDERKHSEKSWHWDLPPVGSTVNVEKAIEINKAKDAAWAKKVFGDKPVVPVPVSGE